jgi:predicted phage baseplate assembly protein
MSEHDLDNCGCCDPSIPAPTVANPPGLPWLAYRIGTHGAFMRRMLARLPHEGIEDAPNQIRYPLARLATRSPDDPAIALLDAWSTIGDVLAFYQERIANEGFLRTATERRSILEQARLIGYELHPGVAASAYLAFGVDTAEGSPASAVVPAGTKVQSVPGQNELPQTFETSADITARLEWNALRPRQMRPQELAINGSTLYLLGLSVGLDAGATALDAAETEPLDAASPVPASGTVQGLEVNAIYVTGTTTNLRSGDVILLAGRRVDGSTTRTLVRTVLRVTEENDLNRTRVEFDAPPPPSTGYTLAGVTMAQASIQHVALNSQSVDQQIVGQTWSNNQLTAWLTTQGWSASNTVGYIFGAHNYPEPKTQLPPGAPGAFALRTRLGFFGHNAPAYASLTATVQGAFYSWDSGLSIWRGSLKVGSTPPSTAPYYEDADCFLERSVAGLTGNGWVVFELPTRQFTVFRLLAAAEASQAGFSLSAKTTGLKLAAADTGTSLGDNSTDKSESFTVRKTTAHVQSDRLILVQLPIEAPLGKGTPEQHQVTLDRMVLNLSAGQPVAVTGERDDLPGVKVSEVVILDTIQHSGGFTTLFLASPGLRFRYVRKTVTINANVAPATHGDTVTEVLGGGDAARPNQSFVLKKPPLTYTSSADPSGARSSLAVRVNRVLWWESPHLYGLDGKSETYIVRHDDEGKASVVFGDGTQGARLPTGAGNVVATYRSGIGLAGMVGAGKLALLMTRPLGIRGVTNPLPATGAADPESRDGARENAPLTVLAMGRIVSLQDAEDFARAFAGIGKARAIALWRGGVEWIHLTVASEAPVPSQDGTVTALSDHRVDVTSPLGQNLIDAIERFKEPSLRLRVDTYQPVFFDLSVKVLVDERHLWADVEAAVTTALVDAFSFEGRAFGQAVTKAEVIRVIQAVAGVVFVDVETLHRFDASPGATPEDVLIPGTVQWADDQPEPAALAELLVINPLGITLIPLPPEAAQ